MRGPTGSRQFEAGRIIVVVVGIVAMFYSMVVATTPLLGEEVYVGTTYANLQATNPRLANIIWHDSVVLGILTFASAFLSVILAWKGLPVVPGLAWYSILSLWTAFLVGLLVAHLPIGNTSFAHVGPVVILLPIEAVGIALSARPVFSRQSRSC